MTMHYIPLYTGDYLRDTRHLSPMEHGIYLLLLMYCWDKHGFAPLEERQLFGICNARSNDEMEAVRRILKEFFVQGAEGWYNPRLMRELNEANARHEAALERMRLGSEFGRKSAEARRKKYGTAQPKRASRKNAGSPEGTFDRPSDAPSSLPSEGNSEGRPNKPTPDPDLYKERESRELDQRASDPITLSETEKAKTDRVRLTRDWKITEEWIVAASSERPELTHAQILISSNRLKYIRLGHLVSLAEWLAWIHSEMVEKQPERSDNGGRDFRPPPPYFHNGEFEAR